MIVNKTFSLLFLSLMLAHLAGCNPFGKLGQNFTLNPAAVISPSESVITASSSQVAAGENILVTVTLKDSAGARIVSNSSLISLSHSDGTSTGTFGEVVSNNDGSFTATFTGVTPGTATTISASVNGEPLTSSLPTVLVFRGLSIVPSITIPKSSGYTYTFIPEHGFPPYTFEMLSGSGSIDVNGVYTAGTTGAEAIVRVTDSLGHYQDSNVHFSHLLIRGDGVTAQVVDDDGNLYIGGSFTGVRPYSAPGAVALNTTNGNPELGFDLQSGFDGYINAIVRDPQSGAIYVGGEFTTYRGLRAKNLVKLNQFGALDTNFNGDGSVFNESVSSLALSPDGTTLYVGGHFTSYRGVADSAWRIAKLSTLNGALDETFHPTSSTGGFNLSVNTIALSSDATTLYVGGNFTSYRGVADSARRIAKLSTSNGALDENFHPVSSSGGFDAVNYWETEVLTLTLSRDNSFLYVGGGFTSYRGIPDSARRIAKISTFNGALDETFHPTSSTGGFNSAVRSLALSSNGETLYAGGQFTGYRNVSNSALRIAKLSTLDGAIYAGFHPVGALGGFDDRVTAIALSADDSALYVGGWFNKYRNVTNSAKRIAKLFTTDGAIDTPFHPISAAEGFTGYVYALSLSTAGTTLFVGGSLGGYRGIEANNIAKINSDGVLDSAFNGDGSGFDAGVSTLALGPSDPDGPVLYVGGSFLSYRGVANSARKIAKLSATNGDINTTFHPVSSSGGFNLSVSSLALSPDGQFLYAGGAFTTYRNTTNSARRIAKLSTSNGAISTTFHPVSSPAGFNSPVNSLAISPDGQFLYAGGNFTTYRGVANSARKIAKLSATNGDINTTFHPAVSTGGFNGAVYSLALNSDGSTLYAGGEFSTYRQENVVGMAKLLTSNGDRDTNFLPGFSGVVSSVALSSDSNLYIGGDVWREEGTIPQGIVKVSNGSIDESFFPTPVSVAGFDQPVSSLVLAPDNSALYVGGYFSTYRSFNVLGWAALDLGDGTLLIP